MNVKSIVIKFLGIVLIVILVEFWKIDTGNFFYNILLKIPAWMVIFSFFKWRDWTD